MYIRRGFDILSSADNLKVPVSKYIARAYNIKIGSYDNIAIISLELPILAYGEPVLIPPTMRATEDTV